MSTLLTAPHRQSHKGFQARSTTRPRTEVLGWQSRPRTDFSAESIVRKPEVDREPAVFSSSSHLHSELIHIHPPWKRANSTRLAPGCREPCRPFRSGLRSGGVDRPPRSRRPPRSSLPPRAERQPHRAGCCPWSVHRQRGGCVRRLRARPPARAQARSAPAASRARCDRRRSGEWQGWRGGAAQTPPAARDAASAKHAPWSIPRKRRRNQCVGMKVTRSTEGIRSACTASCTCRPSSAPSASAMLRHARRFTAGTHCDNGGAYRPSRTSAS